MDPLLKLEDNPLFDEFTREELQEITAASHLASYRPGEVIIQASTRGSLFGVVLEGSVRAETRDASGNVVVLGEIDEGGYFGEVSLVSGEETTASVVAVSPSEILEVPHEVMAGALATHPEAMREVTQTIIERLTANRERADEAKAVPLTAWTNGHDPVIQHHFLRPVSRHHPPTRYSF